jgi:hypothetical protein
LDRKDQPGGGGPALAVPALTIKVTFATLYREPLSDGEEPKTIG